MAASPDIGAHGSLPVLLCAGAVVVLPGRSRRRRVTLARRRVGLRARVLDSEGRKVIDAPPDFDASDSAAVLSSLTVEYATRPFGVFAYVPNATGRGALVWELGAERYPGDPQGRARRAGVREGFAVRAVGGVDVSSWDFWDIMDLLGDKILDNSSGKFQSGARGSMGNASAELPLEVEYVELAGSWGPGGQPVAEEEPRSRAASWESVSQPPEPLPPSLPGLLRYTSEQVDDDFVRRLLELQRQHAGEVVLSLGDAVALVEDAGRALASEETLRKVDLEKVVVVGDLHGQFYDMLAIFERTGMPSESNPYLFNGDFVDRGSNSLEVIFTLLSLKLRFPHSVMLNRGNHESVHLNLRYGFAEEIRTRYGPAGKRLFDSFSEAFRWLPLVHVLNSEVFVVHGGLPGPDPRMPFADAGGGGTGYDAVAPSQDGRSGGRRGAGQHLSLLGYNPDNVSLPPREHELSLQDIAALPRGCDPVTDLRSLEALPEQEAEVQRVLVDLLWADPRGKTGYGPSFRVQKGCYIFGPDVTQAFLERNGLRLIIRSHEVKVGGFEWTHPSLITVFSAPNYLGHARNKGAVVTLTRSSQTGHLEPSFTQYEGSEKTTYRSS